jgi:predicted DNA-binding transcriptional regulator AlpA
MSELEALSREQKIELVARLIASLLPESQSPTESTSTPELLDVTQAAKLLSVTKQWVYRNARNLKLTVDLSPGTVRYSRAAILKYIAKKNA